MKSMAKKLLEHLNRTNIVNEESLPRLDGFVATVADDICQGNTKSKYGQKVIKFFTQDERDLTLKLLRSVDNRIPGDVVGALFLSGGNLKDIMDYDIIEPQEARLIKKNPETFKLIDELSDAFDEELSNEEVIG